MATKTVVSVVDDIDGSESAETVAFTYKGSTYEIDLAPKNREALDAALAPFISAARSTGRRNGARRTSRGGDAAAVRAWAAENGVDVSARGRIPRDVLDKFAKR